MWNEARTINRLANTLMVLAVLAMLAGGIYWLIQRPQFELQAIEIEPAPNSTLHYVTPASIQNAIAGNLTGNFFTINLVDAQKVFEDAPWVRSASVRRIWPNAIRVSIEEQQPLALWNESQMLNTWGQVFTANQGELDDDVVLPQFDGPEGKEGLVVHRYAELARWFAPLDVTVRKLSLSDRLAWQVTLSNGMTLALGRDPGADAPDPQGGIPGALPFAERIQRFVQALPMASQKIGDRAVTHADLRYPNGFALTLAALPENPQLKKKR
ncbi:FtsQ Cell division septal protein [Burkholderiaceae bacterium]